MKTLVSIDGCLVEAENALISVFDRGFLFGDSIYETFRVYQGLPFKYDEHIDRLKRSASRLHLDLPVELPRLTGWIDAIVKTAGGGDGLLRITVTRGAGDQAIGLRIGSSTPKVILILSPLPKNHDETLSRGVSVYLPSVQRTSKAALDPAIKSGNKLNNILALDEAIGQGFDDCLMLNADGYLTELSNSNFFMCLGDTIHTPSLECGLLDGITRKIVIDICRDHRLALQERILTVDDLDRADEAFITSTSREVVPILRIGRHDFKGCPGAMTAKVVLLFKQAVRSYFDDVRRRRR